MKKYLLVILTCYFGTLCHAQLRIDSKKELSEDPQIIRNFITDNHFEYALLSWSTSNWDRNDCDFRGLIKQDGKWYLAYVRRVLLPYIKLFDQGIMTKQQALTQLQADSLMKIIKPDSAFRYDQARLDKLPPSCDYTENGQKINRHIFDAGVSFLMELKNNKKQIVSYYAAEYWFTECYPHVKEFEILKGLVNTTEQMYALTKDLSKR